MSFLTTQADPSRPPVAIPEVELTQLGLTVGDSAEIARVASTIQTGRRLFFFGRIPSKMIKHVRNLPHDFSDGLHV